MKLLAFMSLAALAQVTFANFDIYRVNAASGSTAEYGYQIFSNDPSCYNVSATSWYGARTDVSGNNIGVRCNGDGCNGNNVR